MGINKRKKTIPLGISIGSTNKTYKDIEEMADDIATSFERVLKEDYFIYFELNISCPNLINTENLVEKFDTPNGLNFLLSKLEKLQIRPFDQIDLLQPFPYRTCLRLRELQPGSTR